jgi:hypothetical protein
MPKRRWGFLPMRHLTTFAILAALSLVLTTASIGSILSQLGRLPQEDQLVDRLLDGGIAQLYLMPLVWRNVLPAAIDPNAWRPWLSVAAFVPMAIITALVLWQWRRRGRRDYTLAGLLCLLGAAVPWAIGAYLLARITDPSEAGPRILLMLGGVLWGGIACVGCGSWQWWRDRRAVASPMA